MRLLECVLEHEPQRTTCAVTVRSDDLLAAADGRVPGFVALEWMAQCASVHAALIGRERGGGGPPARGLLLGSRVLELGRASYAPGERLVVEAQHFKGERGLVIFDCRLRDADGRELASGRLNLYTVPGGADESGER